jgi:hypothetical protein
LRKILTQNEEFIFSTQLKFAVLLNLYSCFVR